MPVSCTNFQIENKVMNEIKSKFEYISIAFHFIKCLKSDELYRLVVFYDFYLFFFGRNKNGANLYRETDKV